MRELVPLQGVSEVASDKSRQACSINDSDMCCICGEIYTNADNSLSHKLFGTLHTSEGFGGGMGQFVPLAVLSPAERLRANCTEEVRVARCAGLIPHDKIAGMK